MIVRTLRILLCATMLGVLPGASAGADDYPARPITIVVSLAAGSGMDAITRLYGQLDHTIKLTNAIIISVKQSLQIPQSGGPIIDSRELQEISLTFQKIDITSIPGKTEAMDDWESAIT